ncbi:hypothetical protein C8F04DRAFT_1108815 [Mycena alexandri]|uniref:Pali-domain-containing protein n=1 Tax=Mycena alexandri TaxID=1745969 RepID=A0AAD6ST10_9AGAR|nr:hypothetical protein C8F04DRAFT_1108815 [Mycena alexandri]
MRTHRHLLILLFYPLAVSSPGAPAKCALIFKNADDDWIYSVNSVVNDRSNFLSLYNQDLPSKFNLCLSYGQLQISYAPGLGVPANNLLPGLRVFVALFTLLRELESASSHAEYAGLQTQLQTEWLKVGGVFPSFLPTCLLTLSVDFGAFALAPDSLLGPANTITRITLAGGSIASAAGLLCDAYLLLRFSRASIQAFKVSTAEDEFRPTNIAAGPLVTAAPTYIAFAVLARLPLILVLFATACITVLLGAAAYELSPPIALSVLGLAAGVLTLRYLIWALVWVVFAFSRIWIAGVSAYGYGVGRMRALFNGSGA